MTCTATPSGSADRHRPRHDRRWEAPRQGLEAWFSPELFEHGQNEILEYIVGAAQSAEKLRRNWRVRRSLSRRSDHRHVRNVLGPYLGYQRPVVISEVGCCTYRGAEDAGGMGWAIVDYAKTPLRLDDDYERDETLQARELVGQLDLLDSQGIDGAFVMTFVSPSSLRPACATKGKRGRRGEGARIVAVREPDGGRGRSRECLS